MSGGSFQLHVMRNSGSTPQPSAVLLLLHFFLLSTPLFNRHPFPILYLFLCKVFILIFSPFHTFLAHPSWSYCTPPLLVPLHSLPTKFLSLRGWDVGVLNLKSLVRTLTGTGHSRCCSHQAGHSSTQGQDTAGVAKEGGERACFGG